MFIPLLRPCVPPGPTDSLDSVWTYARDSMARFTWRQAVLALSSLAFAQDTPSGLPAADGLTTTAYGTSTGSIASATVSGATSTFSIPFTVPAAADIGPNLLPNVQDPSAKQAQQLCPGYKASDVKHTANGFTATLNLAGDAVRHANHLFWR